MSKIGDVYFIPTLRRYFQLVAFDRTQLNSDVIAVFNYEGDTKEIESIVDSGVEFFTHTSVNPGVKQGLWRKVGKSDTVDYSKAQFKDAYFGDSPPEVESYEVDSYHSWVVWGVNEEWQHIGSNIKNYSNAELGHVFAPANIVSRIQNGRYPGPAYYGEYR